MREGQEEDGVGGRDQVTSSIGLRGAQLDGGQKRRDLSEQSDSPADFSEKSSSKIAAIYR